MPLILALITLLMAQPAAPLSEKSAVDMARDVLRKDLRLAVSDVLDLVSATPVTWPDASLGCAEPDRSYAQIATEGYRVALRHAGKVYRVSVVTDRAVVCGPPLEVRAMKPEGQAVEPTEEGAMPADAASRKLVLDVAGDLAKRLSLSADAVHFVSFKSVVWPDSSLGCPRPDMGYAQVQSDGAVIRLNANDRVYEYHSGGGKPPFLCEAGGKPKR